MPRKAQKTKIPAKKVVPKTKTRATKTTHVAAKKQMAKPVATRRKTSTKQTEEATTNIWAQSYTNLLLGVIVVIIGVLFVVTLIRTKHTQNIQETSSISTVAPTTQPAPTKTPKQQIYIVKQGDDLWHISEKFYQSGYNYVDIAKANNLGNPSALDAGQKLIIPSITPSSIKTVEPTTMAQEQTNTQQSAIKTDTYIVQKGDNLWDIAVRAYADGYQWPKIASANHLADPGLIFSGNVLIIPR